MSEHVHDCDKCNAYTVCGEDPCDIDQSATCWSCLRKERDSLKAQLDLAHAFHDVAVKERDAARIEVTRLKIALEERWADCHDGSDQACCKSHE